MKTIYVDKFPKCDICRKFDGVYDAPTKGGPWANMCHTCMVQFGNPAIGSKREIQPIVEKRNIGRLEQAFVIDSLEEIVESGIQTVKCPLCDTRKRVEADANYVYDCKCGAKVSVSPNF